MYLYDECGLDNVFLKNGFRKEVIDGDEVVFIRDVDALHEAIGRAIASKPEILSKAEVRFLRKELDLSQKDLGTLLGVTDQTIALWENEKRKTEIGKSDSTMLKIVYLQALEESPDAIKMLEESKRITDLSYAILNLERRGKQGWKPAKAAPKKTAQRAPGKKRVAGSGRQIEMPGSGFEKKT
jgi:DNA-binding transcriptional regulator YiaG